MLYKATSKKERKEGREREREGGREGGRKGGREEGRKGGRKNEQSFVFRVPWQSQLCSCVPWTLCLMLPVSEGN